MKKLAILSDTHGLLRDEVKALLSQTDAILHAGDIDTLAVLNQLRGYAPVYIVRGNNDFFCGAELSHSLTATIEGVRFFIVHDQRDIPWPLPDVDVILYGHSHKYAQKVIDGKLWLNPGSCGRRRFGLDITMCVMTVEQGSYHVEMIPIGSSDVASAGGAHTP